MYLNFYHLRKEPFHITPDPSFLYLSPAHKEALGAVIYGTEQRKGFISVTGEVGTGKTTVIRSYLEGIDREKTKPIYIFNSNSSFKELLQVIASELEINDPETESVHALLHRLQEALIEEFRQDHNVVLLIDEAQNMPVHTLENLRMLSNLETTRDKLIPIVLVGQGAKPKNSAFFHELRQRIAYRAHIHPLATKESSDYIQFRLDKVRLQREPLFAPTALRRIVDHAGGSPRVLNILCDNCLLAGFGYQAKPVTAKIAREVIADFEGGRRSARRWKYALAAVLVLGLAGYLLSPPGQAMRGRLGLVEPGTQLAGWWGGLAGEQASQQTVAPSTLPAASTESPAPVPTPQPSAPVVEPVTAPEPLVAPVVLAATSAPEPEPVPVAAATAEVAAATAPEPAPSVAAATEPVGEAAPTASVEAGIETIRIATSSLEFPSDLGRRRSIPRQPRSSDGAVVYTVRSGDVLSQLCLEVYGFSSVSLIQWIQGHNARIQDPNQISPGDQLVFPALGARKEYLRLGGSSVLSDGNTTGTSP